MMRYIILFLLICAGCIAHGQSQETPPVIGEPLPDFSFDVRYGEPGVKKVSQFRGKPLLLYFFGKGCVGSFYGLPEINAVYKKYKSQLTVIGVAADMHDKVADSYERYRAYYKLELPVAIDSVNYRQLGIYGFPKLILIDANGIVKAVTYSLAEEAIEQFLKEEPFFFHNTSQQYKRASKFDPLKPLFVNGNGGSGDEFLQRSLLSEWKPGMPRLTLSPANEFNPEPFASVQALNIAGRSLAELYRIAYLGRSIAWEPWDTVAYGNYHFNVVLELRDTSRFAYDLAAGKNMFNYTQVLQPHMRTKENMMRVMQTDLKNCFGYEVSVEMRKMPYLRLIAKPGVAEKLKSVAGKEKGKGNNVDGVDYRNRSMQNVRLLINSSVRLSTLDLPLLDETGITGNVDITVRGVMTSLEDVTRALRSQGLDIVRGEREMKVIVIRDAPVQLK